MTPLNVNSQTKTLMYTNTHTLNMDKMTRPPLHMECFNVLYVRANASYCEDCCHMVISSHVQLSGKLKLFWATG